MKTVIVGAGPAGLFAAHELLHVDKTHEVIIIEKGKDIMSRSCPMATTGKCAKCPQCNIAFGVGGAGLFSDGKLIYSNRTGTNLPDLIGNEKTTAVVNRVRNIFESLEEQNSFLPLGHIVIPADVGYDQHSAEEFMRLANQNGIEYIQAEQTHVGSDRLPARISKLIEKFGDRAKFVHETVTNIEAGIVYTTDNKYTCDNIIVGPGRSGGAWVEGLANNLNIKYEFNPVDIGVRVEVPASIMEEICQASWDVKARIRLSNDDEVRTFCTCPKGFVAREEYKTYSLVNGHSKHGEFSKNTNFAFLVKMKLTDPLKNGNDLGSKLAEQVTYIGGGKPIIQRLEDLRNNRRSTWHKINRSYVEPTLKDVTPGDIGMAMGYRFVRDLLEGIDTLNSLIPGVNSGHTLFYAPEIKSHGIRFDLTEYMESTVPGIFFVGDAAGYSRGIVGAAATGVLAARGALRRHDSIV